MSVQAPESVVARASTTLKSRRKRAPAPGGRAATAAADWRAGLKADPLGAPRPIWQRGEILAEENGKFVAEQA
jgi:hypothetical protein